MKRLTQIREARTAVDRFNAQTAGTPIRVTIRDDSPGGDAGFDRVFVGLGATLDAIPEVLERAGVPAVRKAFDQNFRDQSGRTRWVALAPATIRDRARRGYGPGPILQRSGRLRRSVVNAPAKVTRSGQNVTLKIAPAEAGGVPYYRIQALGGRAGNGSRIPSRPMVVVRPAQAVQITSAVSRGLRAEAGRNGLG